MITSYQAIAIGGTLLLAFCYLCHFMSYARSKGKRPGAIFGQWVAVALIAAQIIREIVR
jgi:hypothetical protein